MKTKKIYNITILTIFVMVIALACTKKEKTASVKEDKKDKDYTAPKNIIDVEKSINLYNAYSKSRSEYVAPYLQKIYENPNFQDTKFVWYSLEEMKEYIAYIEKVQRENPAYDITGIRFYYGAYSQKSQSKRFPNQQTLFMAPTMKTSKSGSKYPNMDNIPFYIEYTDESNPIKGKLVAIPSLMLEQNQKRTQPYFKTNTQKGSFNLFTSSTLTTAAARRTSVIKNEGEMSPPPFE
ncbi:hypothetical protein GCM10022291_34200 [Postechiella marina]|uniref:Lipoprotein n=1 Tax=Postechiella marina TaxID=943941 RepID=A0ABP8CIL2_9FLAO